MSPESILTIAVMDSGLALRAPRNDGRKRAPPGGGKTGRSLMSDYAMRASLK